MMQQSTAIKVHLGQSKLQIDRLGEDRKRRDAKLDVLYVRRHTAQCVQPTCGYLCGYVIKHNWACKRGAMCADGCALLSPAWPFEHYGPPQCGAAGADVSSSKPGLALKGTIFSLPL